MARILIPTNARSYRPNDLGAFAATVVMKAGKNPTSVGLTKIAKPAVAVRGSIAANRKPITIPPRGIIWRRPQDMPGATTGRVIPPGMYITPKPPGYQESRYQEMAQPLPYGFRSKRYPGIMGLGDEVIATPETTTMNSPTASADTSSFDWSKLVTALITTGGSIGTSLIGARREIAAPSTTVVQMPSGPASSGSSGVSTQALVIGGAIAAGVLALVLILKK